MAWLHYYVRHDATTTLVGEGYEEHADRQSVEILAAIQARLSAGLTALDAASNPQPPRASPPPDPLAPKRVRLTELRAKGWANLTAAEREEARGLVFDLGGSP